MVKVTVIIPVYNVEQYLKKCVESIQNQTYSNLEIILVNDGSTDGSGECCDRLKENDGRIKVIHKENGGLSSARNVGLECATGKYIYFLDSDDYVDADLVENCVDLMEQGKELVIFNYRKVDQDGKILSYSHFPKQEWVFKEDEERLKFLFQELFHYKVGWEAWDRFYSRNIIEKHHLRFADNNKIFAEDLYFFMCYIGCISSVYSCGKVFYNYLLREESIMRNSINHAYNMNRINNLSFALKNFYESTEECKALVEVFPLIHFNLLNPEIKKLQNENWSLKEIGNFLQNKMENTEFCKQEFLSFLKQYKQYYKICKKFDVQENKNLLQYFQDYDYRKLRISNKLLYWSTLKKENFRLKKELISSKRKSNTPKIYVVGTEDFGNLGDHFIAETIITFLKKFFKDREICEITASNFGKMFEWLKKDIRNGDIITLTGGGNMGNVYPFAENIRKQIISTFTKNKIVIFPQTIFFDKKVQDYTCEDIKMYDRDNIVLAARDQKSYALIQNFERAKVMFVPDIVLWNNLSDEETDRNQILICLREDKEGVLDYAQRQSIINYAREQMKTILYDTQLPYSIAFTDREKELQECVNEFKKAKLVITDRLHGMIISAITGTPCIVLDNYNQKVSGSYQWIKDLPYIYYVDNIEDLESLIERVIENTGYYKYELNDAERFEEFARNF